METQWLTVRRGAKSLKNQSLMHYRPPTRPPALFYLLDLGAQTLEGSSWTDDGNDVKTEMQHPHPTRWFRWVHLASPLNIMLQWRVTKCLIFQSKPGTEWFYSEKRCWMNQRDCWPSEDHLDSAGLLSNSSVIGRRRDRDNLLTTKQPSAASQAMIQFFDCFGSCGKQVTAIRPVELRHLWIGFCLDSNACWFLFFAATDWKSDCRKNAAHFSVVLDLCWLKDCRF